MSAPFTMLLPSATFIFSNINLLEQKSIETYICWFACTCKHPIVSVEAADTAKNYCLVYEGDLLRNRNSYTGDMVEPLQSFIRLLNRFWSRLRGFSLYQAFMQPHSAVNQSRLNFKTRCFCEQDVFAALSLPMDLNISCQCRSEFMRQQ